MKKVIIILIIMLLIINTIFTNEIHTYESKNIKDIKIGNNDGELGYNIIFHKGAVGYPSSFTISEDNYMYVCDGLNNRISIFDLELNFIRNINVDKKNPISGSSYLKFDNDTIIGGVGDSIIKIDKNGKELLRITKYDAARDGGVEFYKRFDHVRNNVFPIDGNILLIDSRKKKTYIYNASGKYIPEKESKKVMNALRSNSRNVMKIDNELNGFLEKNNFIMRNDRLLTHAYHDYKEYFKIVKKIHKKRIIEEENEFDISILRIFKVFGYDKDNNSYWRAETGRFSKKAILVHSQYGDVLDCFYYAIEPSDPAVSPAGDIYFMSMDIKGIHFAKITRRW